MLRLGITGGIGMGKSTAARMLEQAGVRVVDTDQLAREVVAPGSPGLEAVLRHFGQHLATPTGLDRSALASLIFANAAARHELEAILHPLIRERWEEQLTIWEREKVPISAVIIPLLFETGAEKQFDQVISVVCSSAAQQERLLARGWTLEHLRSRLEAQWPVERKIAVSDHVVWTDGDLASHEEQWRVLLSGWERGSEKV